MSFNKFVRFFLISGLQFSVYFFLYIVTFSLTESGFLSSSVGFFVAVILAKNIQSKFVWKNDISYWHFFQVYGLTAILNIFLVFLVVDIAGFQSLLIPFFIAIFIFLLNFFWLNMRMK